MRTIERARWRAALPAVLREVSERWALRVGEPFEHDGECSWVAPVRADGADLVLKLGWYHTEAAHEADALRLWRGAGAIRLHAAAELDGTCALLLERCLPGTTLKQSMTEPDQDLVVTDLLRRLWIQPSGGHRFRPLETMCDLWADSFEARFARSPDMLDPGLAREGAGLFRTLPRTAAQSVLLCTDLHGGNILAAEREPWLVIDPKPYLGDPASDVVQHMLNCTERLESDPAGMVARLADLLDLDRERVTLWLFARCVVESAGWTELRAVAARLAP
ncbi:MAG: aminoglycoside phosphotransferase family protein [Labedaea sp.]